MAISLKTQYEDYWPGYVENWLVIDSDNKAVDQFRYVVDIYSGSTVTTPGYLGRFQVSPRPGDGYGVLNMQKILASQLGYSLSADTLGFIEAPGHYLDYIVQIGETTPYWQFTDNNNQCLPKVAFTGVSDHNLVAGQEITIQQDNGYVNESYQGYTTVDSAVSSTIVCTTKLWDEPTVPNPGRIYKTNGDSFIDVGLTSFTSSITSAVIDRNDISSWDVDEYNFASNGTKMLTNVPGTFNMDRSNRAKVAFANKSNFFTRMRVKTYSGDSALQGEYTFTNPYLSPSIDERKVLHFGCGPWNLENALAAQFAVVSGPSTIIDSNVTSYTYFLERQAASYTSETKTVQIIDATSCPWGNFQILFLDRKGSWMPFNFCMRSKEMHNINKKTYKKPISQDLTSVQQTSFSNQSRGHTVYNTDLKKSYEITTDYLNDADSEYFMELLQSPEVYHIDDTHGALPIVLNSGNYERQKEINGLITYTVKFQYAWGESTQQF